MPSELNAAFAAALRGGALPPGLAAPAPGEVARRYAVYRNNVAASLTGALARRFPVIERLVGRDFFRAMALIHAEADRPRSPVLAEWGEGFPAFLAAFPPLAAYPYMADVARIELARGRAFHAADARPLDPAMLAGADPETLRLRLHPSVRLLHLSHPAVSIWAMNQPGAVPGTLTQGPEIALIIRDAGFEVQVHAIGAGDAALIGALMDGVPLARAAALAQGSEPGHDPQPRLVHLMAAGVIVEPQE
jgi:hypothetical protein